MTTVVFDPQVKGHHLEYLHNLYCEAVRHPDEHFVFAIPQEFNDYKGQYEWESCDNVQFDVQDDYSVCQVSNQYIKAWRLSRMLRKIVKRHEANQVFLIMLSQTMPWLPFLMPSGVTVHGIVYDIPRYETSAGQRLKDTFYMKTLGRHGAVGSVMMLNDKQEADSLNGASGSQRFVYLPDPIQHIDLSNIENVRQTIGVRNDEKVFLHFGDLSKRKGTLEIIKAIALLPQSTLEKTCFVFAGRVFDDIKQEYYDIYQTLRAKANIVLYDQYCENAFLFNLCYSCDYMLIPYLQSYRSSGVVGYASLFAKPVLGPADGLIGRLIKEYGVGLTVENVNPQSLADGIVMMSETEDLPKSFPDIRSYSQTHTVEEFNRVIFQRLTAKR